MRKRVVTQLAKRVQALQVAANTPSAALAISDVSGLQTALDGKAASSHTQAISTVTGLQAALDAKAGSSHTHAMSDVTSLVATLSGKSDIGHDHDERYYTQAEVDTLLGGLGGSGLTHPQVMARSSFRL